MKIEMKTTQILLLFAASLTVFAGCGKTGIADNQEGFILTVNDRYVQLMVEAQSLTIDWGDGTIETYEHCDSSTDISHLYERKWAYLLFPSRHTITAITENLTQLRNLTGGCMNSDISIWERRTTTLDVSRCTALTYLSFTDLTGLDVSKNVNLIELYCEGELNQLDVSKNTELTVLDCSGCQLDTLDVSKNTKLRRLNCGYNGLSNLDVSKNKELKMLNCEYNFFSAKAINALFNTLPVVKQEDEFIEVEHNEYDRIIEYHIITVEDNTDDNDEYDASIAEKRGWKVSDMSRK
jgi:Leucine-rich repeat (LRR) protein